MPTGRIIDWGNRVPTGLRFGRKALKSYRARARSRSHPRGPFPLEALEGRLVLAAPAPPMLIPPLPLLDPLTVPQFVNPLPNPLTQLTPYTPKGLDGNGFKHYQIGTALLPQQDLGLGQGRLTDVFAYGNLGVPAEGFSYPGRTLEVQKNQPISVSWSNALPQQHVVPVDPTLLLDGRLTYDPLTNSINEGVPMVPHLHGGHTDAVYDGTPLQYWTAGGVKGEDWRYDSYVYANDQDAATLWYHDHAMGVTRLNAYAGLAGFYIIRDGADTGLANNSLGLPAGQYEVPIVIQDKQFLADGSLWYPAMAQTWNGTANVASTMPEMFGDTIVVNGKAWPKLDVQPKRYRLRLLNGSDSRFYTMTLTNPGVAQIGNTINSATPFWQIGTDAGLLNAPVKLPTLVLAPGERIDVIVDFTKFKPGTQFILSNTANAPFPGGAKVVAGLTDRIMAFNVVPSDGTPDLSKAPSAITSLRPDAITPIDPLTPGTRQVALYETLDPMGRILPLLGTPGSSYEFMDPVTENITKGATEVWEIYNNTPDAHPIHLHQVKFQLVSRQAFSSKVGPGPLPGSVAMGPITLRGAPLPAARNELAWKDTIQVMPGEVVKVRATFDLEGKYVWHCHILSHEEHDMMRPFQVGTVADPAPRNLYTPAVVAANLATPGESTSVQGLFSTTSIAASNDILSAPPGTKLEDTVAGDALAELLA